MGKKFGKKLSSCFSSRQHHHHKSRPPSKRAVVPSPPPPTLAEAKASAKKKAGFRLWMRMGLDGQSEILECDKSAIIRRAAIPARDLGILGPIFSHSSNILAREKAMVINLEFIKAIVTAEEVLVLDPLCLEVLPFVDQLRQKLPLKNPFGIHKMEHTEVQSEEEILTGRQLFSVIEAAESELPFEFQVLEIAMEIVCRYLDSSVADLERDAYPMLDELAMNVSNKNLKRVRSLKSNLTRLLARVQKVRDEIEHLLDDNENMEDLYLTRKQMQCKNFEALIASAASNSIVATAPNRARVASNMRGSASIVTNIYSGDNVEDLEMLLEAYFMQLDAARNKILSVREYIDDTEVYINIQLDSQRNQLIQLHLMLTVFSLAIAFNVLAVGIFSINVPCTLYSVNRLFVPFIVGTSSGSFLIFLFIVGYARWKNLIGP